jgi:hypothetical protein
MPRICKSIYFVPFAGIGSLAKYDVITFRKYYMDTDVFDTEISLTNMTKVFIELSASHIHRNMIRKLRSLNSKSMHPLILAASIVAVIFAAQHQVQAAPNDNWLANLGEAQNQGRDDGERDAENGYSKSPSCPSNYGAGLCVAYNHGYNEGYDAEIMAGGSPDD